MKKLQTSIILNKYYKFFDKYVSSACFSLQANQVMHVESQE